MQRFIQLKKWNFWLIKSREHTNFTFMPHSHSIEATKLFIINNFNVDKKKVDEIVSNCINTVTEKERYIKLEIKNSFIDVDFNNNWVQNLNRFIIQLS